VSPSVEKQQSLRRRANATLDIWLPSQPQHHRPFTGTKSQWLMTVARVGEQLALKAERPGLEPVTFCLSREPEALAVTPSAYAQSMLCKLESDRHTVAFRSSSDQTSAERIGGRHSGRLAAKFRFLNFMFPAFI